MRVIEKPSKDVRCPRCNALLRIYHEDIRGDAYEGYWTRCASCACVFDLDDNIKQNMKGQDW